VSNSRAAQDEYGAPAEGSGDLDGELGRNADDSYSAPADAEYGAPEEDTSRDIDTGYGAPTDTDYAAPGVDAARSAEDDYGAPGNYERSGSQIDPTKVCPGGAIERCVEVCPGTTAKVYGACMKGCGDRCP